MSASGPSATTIIFWTILGYIAAFAAVVTSILKRPIIGLRAAIVVDFLISISDKAVIGLLIAVIGMGLRFASSVKAYFAWQNG